MAEPDSREGGKAAAWAVHGFTATGTLFAFLALMAIDQDNHALALAWLVVALVVDGVDGSLARAARVTERAPRIDGPALDLIIDYLNYVFVPTIFLWKAALIPSAWAVPLAAAILISALYNFTRRDMKTSDNYFRGFPALWNLIAIYLFVLRPDPAVASAIILFFAAMTFAPVHFVHPFRVRDYGPWLLLLSGFWAAVTAALLIPGLEDGLRRLLVRASVLSAVLLLGLGLLRTLRGPAPRRPRNFSR